VYRGYKPQVSPIAFAGCTGAGCTANRLNLLTDSRSRGHIPLPGTCSAQCYEAGTAKIYHRRFARELFCERCFPWNLKPKSGLIAVDPISVVRKLRDAKAHLPRVFITRRCRDSGCGQRRRGFIDYSGNGQRHSGTRFRAHLAFPSCKLRVAADPRDGVPPTVTARRV